jgi:hypothetical protein
MRVITHTENRFISLPVICHQDSINCALFENLFRQLKKINTEDGDLNGLKIHATFANTILRCNSLDKRCLGRKGNASITMLAH